MDKSKEFKILGNETNYTYLPERTIKCKCDNPKCEIKDRIYYRSPYDVIYEYNGKTFHSYNCRSQYRKTHKPKKKLKYFED